MAIKSKEAIDAYKAKLAEPFNDAELKLITDRESEIDSVIKSKFKGESVYIELAHFKFGDYFNRDKRTDLLEKALEKRYKDAGWILKVELDDGLDGPNRSGPDYMKLTPIAYRKKN